MTKIDKKYMELIELCYIIKDDKNVTILREDFCWLCGLSILYFKIAYFPDIEFRTMCKDWAHLVNYKNQKKGFYEKELL